jgi:hypothetical protein
MIKKLLFIFLCGLVSAFVSAQDNSAEDSDKKLIKEASINLRTTVTGNQEQPRVLYILPWQSPLSPDLEIEMLSSQEEAIFGHLERDEVQRQLEFLAETKQKIEKKN